jgi:excisionase family DNA binding protein
VLGILSLEQGEGHENNDFIFNGGEEMTDKPRPEPRLLGLIDTARYLGISKQTLYKLAGKEIPAFKPTGSRVWKFDKQDLDSWIEKQKQGRVA